MVLRQSKIIIQGFEYRLRKCFGTVFLCIACYIVKPGFEVIIAEMIKIFMQVIMLVNTAKSNAIHTSFFRRF